MAAAGQKGKRVVESVENGGRTQEPGSSRGQFNGERKPVQATTYLGYFEYVTVCELEVGARVSSALDEKLYRWIRRPNQQVHRSISRWYRERRHPEDAFTRQL